MTKIPPEIDQLLWTLAEQNNQGAQDEFIRRYPMYREELIRRRQAVATLRAGRPKAAPVAAPTPRFVPLEKVRPTPRPVAAVAALVLVTLAVASYTATVFLTSPGATSSSGRVAIHDPVRQPSPESTPPPVVTPPHSGRPANETGTSTPGADSGSPEAVPPEKQPKYLRPQTVRLKAAHLKDALTLLGAQSDLKVVLAPGMPNPVVAVEYEEVSAIDIFKDLGRKYGFTAFDQGDGSIVIYPGTDAGGGTTTTAEPLRKLGG